MLTIKCFAYSPGGRAPSKIEILPKQREFLMAASKLRLWRPRGGPQTPQKRLPASTRSTRFLGWKEHPPNRPPGMGSYSRIELPFISTLITHKTGGGPAPLRFPRPRTVKKGGEFCSEPPGFFHRVIHSLLNQKRVTFGHTLNSKKVRRACDTFCPFFASRSSKNVFGPQC